MGKKKQGGGGRPAPPPPPPGVAPMMMQVVLMHSYVSTPVKCGNCNADILTMVSYQCGTMALLISLVAGLVCFPCGFLAFLLPCVQDVRHVCPACGAVLAVARRM